MNAIIEALFAAMASLATHRMRSFLTTLGILIATASVITVVSLVQGFSESIKAQFADLGGGAMDLRAQNDNENFRTGKVNNITFADIDELRYGVPGVAKVAPMMLVQSAGVSYRGRSASPQVLATTSDYPLVRGSFPQFGRFIADSDDMRHRRVAVIGTQLREDLHLPVNAVGQYVLVSGEWFKVVGVMEKQGKILGFSQDNYVIIPFDVGRSMMGNSSNPIITASFTVNRIGEAEQVRDRVKRAIRASRGIAPGQDDDFRVEAADTFIKQFSQVTRTATAVLAGIVGISLLVGGIGIMNIMLVSVTERTREIGILKALGATRRIILMQFLLEAGLLALVGGVLGIGVGYLLGQGVASIIPNFPPARTPLWVVLTAAGFSGVVGVVFGIVPAAKAAALDPIEALRYE